MDEIKIKSTTHDYSIYLGYDIYKNLPQHLSTHYSSILILTDENVKKLYLKEVEESLHDYTVYTKVVKPGEESKTIDVFYDVHSYLIEMGCDRNSLMIALGGGVIGDLAGFVAATYMRGIDYIQLPTTILAHDSSVGGKVAINHEFGKNLIGNFHAPRLIIYDIKTLKSLPIKEIRSGYAELIKEALIANDSFFNNILADPIHPLKFHHLQTYLKEGIETKAIIVEQDEKELGVRMHLNLGHTLGHGLETYFKYHTLTHGEAVAIGLLFSLYVSEQLLSADLPTRALFKWLKENGYPLKLEQINLKRLIKLMKSDKKAVNHSIQMVLLSRVGSPLIHKVDDHELEKYLREFFRNLGSDVL